VKSLRFRVVEGRYAVCRLAPDEAVPAWAFSGRLWSITRTPEEISIICAEDAVPASVRHEGGWAALMLEGPFAFGLTGILASALVPLAGAEVPIFALSTFDTDWILLPVAMLEQAVEALKAAGHNEV